MPALRAYAVWLDLWLRLGPAAAESGESWVWILMDPLVDAKVGDSCHHFRGGNRGSKKSHSHMIKSWYQKWSTTKTILVGIVPNPPEKRLSLLAGTQGPLLGQGG